MREIKAIVRRDRLEDVLQAMRQVPNISGVTVSTVQGFGRTTGEGTADTGYGQVQMSKVETVVTAEQLDGVIEAIVGAAHTGRAGDGKIFISAVENSIEIRSRVPRMDGT